MEARKFHVHDKVTPLSEDAAAYRRFLAEDASPGFWGIAGESKPSGDTNACKNILPTPMYAYCRVAYHR
jgi:hypothetical protein